VTLAEHDSSPDLSGLSLADLASYANAEFDSMNSAADAALERLSEALQHAVRLGKALCVAKEKVGRGNWDSWVDVNLPFGTTNANRYCRLAFYEDRLLASSVPLNTKSALAYLKGLPQAPGTRRRHLIDEDQVSEMRRLKESGASLNEIAELMEISKTSVEYHTSDKAKSRAIAYRKRYDKQRLAGKKALERQDRVTAAKKAGGKLDKAYSLVRQLAAELDAAHSEATEGRDALRLALSYTHRAEDNISTAIRHALKETA